MIRFGIVVFDGFDELDVVGPWEVLRSAAKFGAPFETVLFSFEGARTFEASHGLRVVVEAEDPSSFDWIVVPGGGWVSRNTRSAWAEIQRGELTAALRALRATGKSMASDLALWLTERLASAEISLKVAQNMEHQRVGRVHRGARSGRS